MLMLEHPAIIKRPLLAAPNGNMLLGFNIENYQSFIQNQTAIEVQ
ncbi:putative reductase [Yersinia enterocolitica]|nr:putative reductase [Yersinia enterocolitica]